MFSDKIHETYYKTKDTFCNTTIDLIGEMYNCRNNFVFNSGHALYWANTCKYFKYENHVMYECLTIPNEATRKCKNGLQYSYVQN